MNFPYPIHFSKDLYELKIFFIRKSFQFNKAAEAGRTKNHGVIVEAYLIEFIFMHEHEFIISYIAHGYPWRMISFLCTISLQQ